MVIFTFPSTSLPLAMVTPWSLMRTRPPGVKPSASTLTRTLKSCLYVGAVAGFFTFVVVTALAAGGVVVGVVVVGVGVGGTVGVTLGLGPAAGAQAMILRL